MASVLLTTGAFSQNVTTIFHYQTNGETLTEAKTYTCTGGSAEVGTTDDAYNDKLKPESAAYDSSVPDDMKATGKNGQKLGGNAAYVKLMLDTPLQKGDIIQVCGYNPIRIGSEVSNKSVDVAESITTGDSKSNYKVGETIVPASAEGLTTIYIGRATATGTGFAAVKILRESTVDEPVGELAPISWSDDKAVEYKIRTDLDTVELPTLINEEGLEVTYASSNPEIATIDENGVVTLQNDKEGETTISATYSGSAYVETTVKYVINVVSNVVEVYAWEEYPVVETIVVNKSWVAENTSGVLAAESTLLSDENIKINTVYDAKYANYGNSYLGYDFKGSAQLSRVDAAPTEDVKTGTEKADNSPLIVTPEKDLQLVMFFRRQAIEQRIGDEDNVADNVITRTHYIGMKADDGKGVAASAHSDISTSIYPELILGKTLGEAKGDNDYLTCAAIFDLKGGETYTIWARGTTIGLNSIGYILPPAEVTDAAPISWSAEKVEYKVRTDLDTVELPTLNNEEELEVTYASSDPEIATIDENGVVTLQNEKIGETTISATYSGSAYIETTVEYVINVVTNEKEVYEWTAFEPETTFDFDYLKKLDTSNVSSGTSLISDDNIEVKTVYDAKGTSYKGTFFGETYEGSLQIGRVTDAPSSENLEGTENSGSTPLIVRPKTDLQLVMIYRKQAVEMGEPTVVDDEEANEITTTHEIGAYPNDGKALFASEVRDITTKLDQNLIIGGAYDGKPQATGDKDYLYVAVTWDLLAGNDYTIWCKGTTICVNGIGYVLPPVVAPEAPVAKVGEEEVTDNAIELTGENKVVKITAQNEEHNVYYRFEAEESEVEALLLLDTDNSIEHEGKVYAIVPEEGVELSEAGTLLFFAHDPATDLRSEVTAITVTGQGKTSGVAGIGNDVDGVEYYNLQGVRVNNPQNGVYIRRQGNTVSKILVK